MKKILIASLSAAAFAGCVTSYNEPPPPQQPRTIPQENVRIDAPKVSVPTAPPGRRSGGRESVNL